MITKKLKLVRMMFFVNTRAYIYKERKPIKNFSRRFFVQCQLYPH